MNVIKVKKKIEKYKNSCNLYFEVLEICGNQMFLNFIASGACQIVNKTFDTVQDLRNSKYPLALCLNFKTTEDFGDYNYDDEWEPFYQDVDNFFQIYCNPLDGEPIIFDIIEVEDITDKCLEYENKKGKNKKQKDEEYQLLCELRRDKLYTDNIVLIA